MKGAWKSGLVLAAERAVALVDLSVLEGRKVFVQEKYFKSYDEGFAIGVIREWISKAGALMLAQETAADVIVEIRAADWAWTRGSPCSAFRR